MSVRNVVGRTPIEALLFYGYGRVDIKDSLEYVDAFLGLFRANPALLIMERVG